METVVETKTKWAIDADHSEIGFKVKHLVVANIRGSFKEYEAHIYPNSDDFMNAEIDFKLKAGSIFTGNENRDAHLRSADFFDADTFQDITFTSTGYLPGNSTSKYTLLGDLTIKGITKDIQLDVKYRGVMTDPWGNQKAIFSIKGKINRKDYNINFNAPLETGGVLIGEDVSIIAEIQLAKQS